MIFKNPHKEMNIEYTNKTESSVKPSESNSQSNSKFSQEETLNTVKNVDEILCVRESRYGSFSVVSQISQELKRIMRESPNWNKLSDVQKEGLEMVQHKIARALSGDPNYLDNFIDVVGFSSLVKKDMENNGGWL